MKRYKIILSAVVFALILTVTTNAYSVGQTVHFGASNAESGGVSGGTNTAVRTDEELAADSANLAATDAWSNIGQTYITDNIAVTNQKYVYDNGSIVIVVDNSAPASVVDLIASYKDQYDEKGYYFTSSDGRAEEITEPLSEKEQDALMNIAANAGLTFTQQVSSFEWNTFQNTPTINYRPFQSTLTDDYATRVEQLPGGISLIDFTTYEERLEALDAFINFAGITDTVNTKYVVEIKCESTSDSALWSSVPINWQGTDQTHFWQIECLESPVGYIPAFTTFGGSDLLYTFEQPGRYRVAATQILQETYCEALSYSINEYWVVAETGQIIWKNEANGTSFSSLDSDTPVDQQSPSMITPYALTHQGTSYYTALETEIEITATQMDQVFQATNLYTNDFATFRVQ